MLRKQTQFDHSRLEIFTTENFKELWDANSTNYGYDFKYQNWLIDKELSKEKIQIICEIMLKPLISIEERNEYSQAHKKIWDIYNSGRHQEFKKEQYRLREISKKLSDESRLQLIISITEDKSVTLFKNNHETIAEYHNIHEIFELIKNGETKKLIENVRSSSEEVSKKKHKNKLPQILFNGRFYSRQSQCFVNYSEYMCLDFDDFEPDTNIKILKDLVSADPHVLAVFISPSGNGLKVIIKVPKRTSEEHHLQLFYGAKTYFEEILPGFDNNCKSKTHGCYLSYDPDIKIMDESKVLLFNHLEEIPKRGKRKSKIAESDVDQSIKKEKGYDYELLNLNILEIHNEDQIIDIILRNWYNNPDNELKEGNTHNPLNKLAFWLWCNGICDKRINKIFNEEFLGIADLDEEKLSIKVQGATNNPDIFNTSKTIDYEFLNKIKTSLNDEMELIKLLSQRGFNIMDEIVIAELEVIRNLANDFNFWNDIKGKDQNGEINTIGYQVSSSKLIKFLKAKKVVAIEDGKQYTYYKNINNILTDIKLSDVKNIIMSFLHDQHPNNDKLLDLFTSYNYKDQLFSELLVPVIEKERDTKTSVKKFFANGILVIEKGKSPTMLPYSALDKPILDKKIINHAYELNDPSNSDYEMFIKNISGNNYDTFRSAIGYLCTNYKTKSEARAIILNDPTNNFRVANGRTGKGLIGDGIKRLTGFLEVDGKKYNKDNQFALAGVTEDCDIMFLNDVRQGIQFTYFYNIITDSFEIRKMHTNPYSIPFELSPKILISTNYPISGNDGSSKARRLDLVLTNHYSDSYSPIDDFGIEFFSENWTSEQWNSFYKFMVECIQIYLDNGLIMPCEDLMKIKHLYAETSEDFVEFMADTAHNYMDKWSTIETIKSDYYKFSGQLKNNRIITDWVQAWCIAMNLSYNKERQTVNGAKLTSILIKTPVNNLSKMLNINNDKKMVTEGKVIA